MKKEYDFSKGERGKFHNPDAEFNMPIYLEPETLSFVEKIAKKKNSDLSRVVNDLIKTDMQIADYIK
ncbi:MAG: hypothetical protein GY754_02570 [bacterium]|nr:hypothetical protein [bacterium]